MERHWGGMEELWKGLCRANDHVRCFQTRWNESDKQSCSSQHKILKLVILDLNWYSLSPGNKETLTSSRRLDATIFKLRTLHKQFLTRFAGVIRTGLMRSHDLANSLGTTNSLTVLSLYVSFNPRFIIKSYYFWCSRYHQTVDSNGWVLLLESLLRLWVLCSLEGWGTGVQVVGHRAPKLASISESEKSERVDAHGEVKVMLFEENDIGNGDSDVTGMTTQVSSSHGGWVNLGCNAWCFAPFFCFLVEMLYDANTLLSPT